MDTLSDPACRLLLLLLLQDEGESFEFDAAFPTSCTQQNIYETVAKPIVEQVLEGFNGTVMAYGQTGTGKSYTLTELSTSEEDSSSRGIMARAVEDIFAKAAELGGALEVHMQYLQIYMEDVQDLMDPSAKGIKLGEDGGEVVVRGASQLPVTSPEEVYEQLAVGETNRHVANQKLNAHSSRSHAVLPDLIVYTHRKSSSFLAVFSTVLHG